jgi:copper oxidase (laccase) domain-containing protein
MTRQYYCLAWPGIGPRAFEVGPEVREAFMEKDPQAVTLSAFR